MRTRSQRKWQQVCLYMCLNALENYAYEKELTLVFSLNSKRKSIDAHVVTQTKSL